MSRAKLLNILPDLAAGPPPRLQPRAPGFEPLVAEAVSRPDFAPIEMPTVFTGAAEAETPPGLAGEPGLSEFSGFAPDLDALAPQPAEPAVEEPVIIDNDFDINRPEAAAPALAGPDLPDLPDLPGLPDAPPDPPLAREPAAAPDPGGTHAQALEAMEASHKEELARMETVYQMAFNDLVENAIPKAREEIVDAIADQLVPLLAGHMKASLADRMVSALVAEVSELLADSDAVAFELKGPEALLRAFQDQWPDREMPVRLVASDGIDLVAKVGKAVLATRLGEVDRLVGGVAS